MRYVTFRCAYCRERGSQPASAVNRARAKGARLFCDRDCSGASKWKNQTPEELKERKRLYDAEYRQKNLARLKEEKRAYFQRTYDPIKAAADRKKRMAKHVAYCRRPEYREKKHEYDAKRYADQFGPFAECVGILQELKAEIAGRMSKYDIYMANGRYSKYAERRRERRLTSEEFHRR